MPTIHLLVKGLVQGVNYRASAKKEADRLALTGWVRNSADGDVEITATGNTQALQTFEAWCRHGPSHARVTNVIAEPIQETTFSEFSIRRGG